MTMKKVLFILFNLITIAGMAQTKGRFEVHDMGSFKLHVYHTNDALGDASYIIEGKEALVTMEQPLFRDNVAEFDAYLSELGKPVEKRITDYHAGGTGSHDVVMAQGMPAFMKGETYGGMMEGFAQALGDALAAMPTGKATEVAFGTTHTWAGATFGFRRGGASDFPGASILIGGKAYYTHWAPARAHASHLQISSAAAIDAETAEAENSLASGAELFVGGHGGAVRRGAVEFRVAYLKKMKELLRGKQDGRGFRGCDEAGLPRPARRGGAGRAGRGALYE